jgi:hypothetical protein
MLMLINIVCFLYKITIIPITKHAIHVFEWDRFLYLDMIEWLLIIGGEISFFFRTCNKNVCFYSWQNALKLCKKLVS